MNSESNASMDHGIEQDDHLKMNEEKKTLLPPKRSSVLDHYSISFEQLMFVIIIVLPALPAGVSVGFSAIALPELNLNLIQSSWFASLPTLGAILGNFITGYVIDRFGRKLAFFVNTIPAFIGFAFLAGSPKVVHLYIGQTCIGISQGAVTFVATAYIAESLAPDNLHFRSSLASWNILGVTLGLSITYVLGYLFHYDGVALIAASVALLSSILILVFVPESPAWLDQQGRFKEAQQARYQLGCERFDIESSTSYKPISDDINVDETLFSYLLKVRRKDVYMPLLVTTAYFFFQQFSGTQVYSAYMVEIITVKSLTIDSYLTTLICGLIMAMGQISYTSFLPRMGVRKIAITSSLVASSTTLVLGICNHLSSTITVYPYIVDYIHILAVWCNVFFSAMGIATVPYTIIGEIFPADAKGFGSVAVFAVNLFYFINLMIYPQAVVLSSYAIFYVYAIIGFLAVPFIYYCIPETVGRTLEQLSSDFSS
ncbi:facilitated trehalose transporter Tret1-like isoform X2 [Planococcus citri]|uniref:facilitated trehalose transporter Tret1-like isoform X2 n=1 Tax=Planococcus citri TaxID=170843 RepID=UPI0031F74CC6